MLHSNINTCKSEFILYKKIIRNQNTIFEKYIYLTSILYSILIYKQY
eukprot:UN01660